MKYRYTYRDVEVQIAIIAGSDDPEWRVMGWDVLVGGRVLQCSTVQGKTVLYRGECFGDVEDIDIRNTESAAADDRDGVPLLDAGLLQGEPTGFVVTPISQGRGRSLGVDYRQIHFMEDVPFEAINPYIDHMLKLHALYAKENVVRVLEGMVRDA